jgi:hypothetical protein
MKFMHIAKEVLEQAVDNLTQKAEDCFENAQAQHDVADKQNAIADKGHANAEKLVALGKTMMEGAVHLQDEIDLVDPNPSDSAVLRLRTVG